MPVTQVTEPVKVAAKPRLCDSAESSADVCRQHALYCFQPQQPGRRVTIDLFFRTLAQAYGQRAVCVIMSGADSDGVIGLKHIRAQGGLTIAQDPERSGVRQHAGDARSAPGWSIGCCRWRRWRRSYWSSSTNENRMKLPPEIPEADEPDAKVRRRAGRRNGFGGDARSARTKRRLRQVLADVRATDRARFRTLQARDGVAPDRAANAGQFESKPFRSISNSCARIRLEDTRAPPGSAHRRDAFLSRSRCFRCARRPTFRKLFAGKQKDDVIRVWVAGCATGEEAYSIAILLSEHAGRLQGPAKDSDFRDGHRRAGDRGSARRALPVNDRGGRVAGTVACVFCAATRAVTACARKSARRFFSLRTMC